MLYLMHYLPINFIHLKPGRFRNATCNRNQPPTSQVRTEEMTEVWWYTDGSISRTEGNLWSCGNKRGFQVAHHPAVHEAQVQSLGQEDPLEEGMAIHSSILARKSYGQSRLVGYSPWGHRVGHD